MSEPKERFRYLAQLLTDAVASDLAIPPQDWIELHRVLKDVCDLVRPTAYFWNGHMTKDEEKEEA